MQLRRNSTPIRLTEDQAMGWWQAQLARQGVGVVQPSIATPTDVAEASLGLHAARVASPFTTVAARVSTIGGAMIVSGLEESGLITVRCMRRTLHTLPAPLASITHAATRPYRIQHVVAIARRAGLSLADLQPIASDVASLLKGEDFLDHRVIEQELCRSSGMDVVTARLALKLAWEDGRIVYRNRASSWHRESRTFSHASHAFGFNPDLPLEAARRDLILEYYRRYGPATIKDAAGWSGLSGRLITSVLREASAIEVLTPWSNEPCFVLPEDLEQLRGNHQTSTPCAEVTMLGHEDVALKAYWDTRARYMGGMPRAAVFNSIGEALPVIMHNGRVVGRWAWDAARRRVRYTTLADQGQDVRLAVRRAARTHTATLREGHKS